MPSRNKLRIWKARCEQGVYEGSVQSSDWAAAEPKVNPNLRGSVLLVLHVRDS